MIRLLMFCLLFFSQVGLAQIDTSEVIKPFPELMMENEILEHREYFLSTESQDEFDSRKILEIKIEGLPFQSEDRKVLEQRLNFEKKINQSKAQMRGEALDQKGVVGDKIEMNQGKQGKESEVYDINSEGGTYVQESPVLNERIIVSQREILDESDRLFGPTQFDSRIQSRALNPSIEWQHKILEMTKSVGMIVENTQLARISDTVYQLEIGSTLGEKFQLCPGEAFEEEPVAGIGTAFLVGESSMITAAHVFEGTFTGYSVVFGFEIINQNGVYNVFIPEQNVYSVKEIERVDIDLDLIQFRTDRIVNRKMLSVDIDNSSVVDDQIYMIGYPMGLPQKVAVNASILSTDYPHHYYTTLDAFQGNSGSPVIHFESGKVIGVLVSGGSDYQWNGTCNKSVICNYPNCMGERVAKLRAFVD